MVIDHQKTSVNKGGCVKEFFYMPVFILFLTMAGCVLIHDQLQVAPPEVLEEEAKARANPLEKWRAAEEEKAKSP